MRFVIDDPTDPRLDDIRDLKHADKSGEGFVFGEGPLCVERLLASRFPVRCIIGFEGKLDTFLEHHDVGDIPVYQVTRQTLGEVTGFDMHRGLVAVADRAEAWTVDEVVEGARTLAIMEGVGDHENIGSLFRNAAGMDVDGILLGSGAADPLYRRSVRVSMGHVLRLPWARFDGGFTTWQRGLEQLREKGFRLVSLTPHPDAVHIADALAGADKVALLVGAEGPGLTEHAMRATDVRARIPMAEGTDSLNVATSAAIAFYERQRSQRLREVDTA
ncbi:RNA methyltransferase [Corynebacterium sp. HMSC05D03]|uniref:TrmH family RNA methyltransferase n=1 Tax=Corynebacterium sp. HMSC05D03 TaxID=1581115 RepID=UPI0008A17C12|nr:RNA methyltransferase [Corynebacterium sp. HMSC05D03]OFT64806.1 rRNA methyltransferase [Corynebacterium sp. HMSC05D03]